MNLLKYILFAVIIYAILKYIPQNKINDNTIYITVALVTLGLYVFDNFVIRRTEKMTECPIPAPLRFPKIHNLDPHEEDYIHTGLKYYNQDPKESLLHHRQFGHNQVPIDDVRAMIDEQRYNDQPSKFIPAHGTEGEIPYSMAPIIIEMSKLNDLMQQHNWNIPCTTDTHVGKLAKRLIKGKSRGRLNWNPVTKTN